MHPSWKCGGSRVATILLICCSISPSPLWAQPPTDAAAPATTASANGLPTADQITAWQTQAAAIADLSDDLKGKAGELATQAIADIQATETLKNAAQDFAAKTEKVSQRLAEVQQELRRLETAGDPRVDPQASITELETERNEAQQEIVELEKQLATPAADPTARTTRRRAARQFLIEFPSKMQQVEERLAAPPSEGEPAALTNLRQARAQWEREALKAREAAVQNEIALLDAEDAVELPTLTREMFTRQLTRLKKQVELKTDQVNRLRQEEADRRVKEARLAAMRAEPLLKPLLDANEQIAIEERDIRKRHESIQKADLELDQRVSALRKEFQDIQELDREFGLTASVGLRLRKLRSQLPDITFHQIQRQSRLETLEQAQFTLYERKDQLDDLSDIEAAAAEIVADSSDLDPERRKQLKEDALNALRTQHEYLDKVVNAYRNYTDTLTQIDVHEEELIRLTRAFSAFIDERVLWVRSHRPMDLADRAGEWEAIAWAWDPAIWRSLFHAVLYDARQVPYLYGAVGALIIFLLLLRRRMGRRLHEVTKNAQSRVSVSLVPTLRAVEFTVLSAIAWPGLMWFLSWRLMQIAEPRIVLATAVSLSRLALVFLLLDIVRQSMRPHGLCEVHFGLHAATARRIRHRLRQLMLLGIPLAGAVALIHYFNGESQHTFVERSFFIASMLVLAYAAHGLLRRGTGDLRDLETFRDGEWAAQLTILCYLLAVGLPLMLAGLAATGYYYSALKLAIRCQISLGLLLGLISLRAFLLRWLMLRHRRLRLQQLRERQQANQQAQAADEAGLPVPDVNADAADLDSISRQSQRLMNTTFVVVGLIGVWMIWFDVVPALRLLDRWPLWDYTVQVREETVSPEGVPQYETTEILKPVTIAHLVLAVLIVVLTMTAARNLPGLLEITLLERLPIDRSTTYAVTALVRYSLVLIGILLASRTLGIGWSKVQWLAAALTFGLGFGLQEIFANFVSGIIILFEQPVRVGDVVTIDGVSGVVNRIRIRATTITDWDRKEYIVPNREFITGRLLNWTLTDKMNRVVINVGVAYGSDTELVRQTIMTLAEEHENVLDEPAPMVTFEGFGDSALNFVLRAYLPSLDARLQTIHDLHTSIDNQLRNRGIEIPFPQRDLHLRTSVVLSENGHSDSNGQRHPIPQETAEAATE